MEAFIWKWNGMFDHLPEKGMEYLIVNIRWACKGKKTYWILSFPGRLNYFCEYIAVSFLSYSLLLEI